MIDDLKAFFSRRLTPREGQHGDRISHEVRYAAAALMVVCAKADFEDSPDESRAIIRLLGQTFRLDGDEIDELIALIDEDAAVRNLQAFTRLINRYYTIHDKRILIENLWQVAFADGRLDVFEEQFIARVAFMIRLTQDDVQTSKAYVADNWRI